MRILEKKKTKKTMIETQNSDNKKKKHQNMKFNLKSV